MDVAYLGLLVFTACWAVASGLMMLGSIRVGDKVPAWGWAVQFAVSSLVAAYCFWRLV